MTLNRKISLVTSSLFILVTFCLITTNASTIDGYLVNNEGYDGEQQNQNSKEDNSVDTKLHVRSGQARALRELNQEKYQMTEFKSIVVNVKKLSDNTGQEYLAGLVNKADLSQYLRKMEGVLGSEFEHYRLQQSARDHGLFHITLVNPIEYQTLAGKENAIGQPMRIKLLGLGRVSQGANTTFYVVASSQDGQFIRQKLLLGEKDFHVTLGFDAQDVYGVSKGEETLIK